MRALPLAEALDRALADPALARLVERLPHRLLLVRDGEPLAVTPAGHGAAAAAVRVEAPAAVWAAMLAPLPAPGLQSAGAATRSGCGFAIAGPALAVAQSLPLVEHLVERLRAAMNDTVECAAPRHALDRLETRYRSIAWPQGDDCWVFEEAAGDPAQPVMLLLHTAGADARQWHGLMSDAALGRDWRLVAVDLPAHGRSRHPRGWRGEPWALDTGRYLDCITAWMDAAGVERAAIAGCSMGAAAGLAFLARRPERAHGAILLEAPYRSPGRRSPYLDHPAVHGGRIGPAWVQALLSPHSPAAERRHATWIYSRAAPGVYEGDLAFYSDEFDAADHVGAIDAARTPLWLLTGEYDYSATPADSRRVADAVPGALRRDAAAGTLPDDRAPGRVARAFPARSARCGRTWTLAARRPTDEPALLGGIRAALRHHRAPPAGAAPAPRPARRGRVDGLLRVADPPRR